jgi:hypothetical protein
MLIEMVVADKYQIHEHYMVVLDMMLVAMLQHDQYVMSINI